MPRLLDLFCGAGGAAMGYHRAGFDVVGVDINPQPHYPFEFHQADALEYLADYMRHDVTRLDDFDAIHASPPCQAYSRMHARGVWGRASRGSRIEHPDLLGPTRERLDATGLPYIIENVEGAPIRASIMLCGTMFGLPLRKHRWFEVSGFDLLMAPASCGDHRNVYNPWKSVVNGKFQRRTGELFRAAQGTPWIPMAGGASRKAGYTGDLYNAIPPAYTEWIGAQLLAALRVAA